MLLQHGADPNIRNTDGKSALDLADPSAKAVLTGQSLSYILHFTCIFIAKKNRINTQLKEASVYR